MERQDQIRFVRELLESIGRDIEEKIETGALPEEWDGHELRHYIAYKTELNKSALINGPTQRRKDYLKALSRGNL